VKEFPAITLYTRISLILSWIVAGLFAIGGIVSFAAQASNGASFLGFLSMLFIWVIGFFTWLWVRLIPEVLEILIAIEKNTRP